MGKPVPAYTASIQVAAPVDKVWEFVSDGAHLTDWLTLTKSAERLEPPGPLRAGSKFVGTVGKAGGARYLITAADVDCLLRWTAGPPLARRLRLSLKGELRLEPRGDATYATAIFTTPRLATPLLRRMSALDFHHEAARTLMRLRFFLEGMGRPRLD